MIIKSKDEKIIINLETGNIEVKGKNKNEIKKRYV